MAILVVASFLLSYLSWKYVETPFRNKKNISRNNIFFVSALGILLFATLGLIGHKKNGFQNRLENYQKEILQWENYPREIAYREGDCFLRPEQNYTQFKSECTIASSNTLIWGDSHSAALASGWRVGRDVHQLTSSGCPPIIKTDFPSRPHCAEINRFIMEVVNENKYETVILHSNWKRYSEEQLDNILLTIQKLHDNGVKNIVLIGGVPQYAQSLPSRLLLERTQLGAIAFIEESQSNIVSYDEKLQALINGMNVNFVSALGQFCSKDRCRVTTQFKGETIPMAWDYGHLTEGGAIWFSNQIDSFTEK